MFGALVFSKFLVGIIFIVELVVVEFIDLASFSDS